jgi:uroporphyrinogen-III synthase
LITRPAAEADALAGILHRLGWTAVIAPLLQIHPADATWPGFIDAVVATSGNALPAVRTLRHLPLFAVGDATARRAAEIGFSHVQSASGDAEDLASLIRTKVPPGATLAVPTAEGEGRVLMARLIAQGFDVQHRIGYRVDPVPELPRAATDALQAGRLHAALFLSARTASTFVDLLPVALYPSLAGVQAIAIGQPAAERLAPLPWGRVRVSLAPTLDQVLAQL